MHEWGEGAYVHISCTTRAWLQDFQLTVTDMFSLQNIFFFSFSFSPSDLILEEAGVKEKCFFSRT